MALNNPYVGENFVSSYQMSAVPWVTSSVISLGQVQIHEFKYATRFFKIEMISSGSIAVAFTARGFSTGNSFTLSQNQSFRDELRVTKLFVSCSFGSNLNYQVVAGLTNIPFSNVLPVTASNGHLGVG